MALSKILRVYTLLQEKPMTAREVAAIVYAHEPERQGRQHAQEAISRLRNVHGKPVAVVGYRQRTDDYKAGLQSAAIFAVSDAPDVPAPDNRAKRKPIQAKTPKPITTTGVRSVFDWHERFR